MRLNEKKTNFTWNEMIKEKLLSHFLYIKNQFYKLFHNFIIKTCVSSNLIQWDSFESLFFILIQSTLHQNQFFLSPSLLDNFSFSLQKILNWVFLFFSIFHCFPLNFPHKLLTSHYTDYIYIVFNCFCLKLYEFSTLF